MADWGYGGGLRVQFPGRLFSPIFPFSSPLAFFSLQILSTPENRCCSLPQSSECLVHPDQAASPSASTFVLHCSINFGFCNKNKNTKLKSNFNCLFADSVNCSPWQPLLLYESDKKYQILLNLIKKKYLTKSIFLKSSKFSEYFLCLNEKKFRRY